MVAPSTMSLLLITLLVNQCYGAMFFGSFINNYPCPRLKECNLSCARGYEKNILNCEICKCQSKPPCEGLTCREGQHCVPYYKVDWLVFKIPHCVNDEPKTIREISSTATTTTTTTTTPAQLAPRSKVCQYGDKVSDCGISKPCEDPSKYKCVIHSPLGFGDCCLKEPEEPTPFLPSTGEMPRCMQVADIGPCRGMIPRYYYNVETGLCQKFNYGGCMENENNFATIEECRDTCENPCTMTPSVGRCRAAIVRYFFNSTEGKCQRFTFGGCQGNGNNWRTMEECRQMCDKSVNNGRYFIGKNEVDESNKP